MVDLALFKTQSLTTPEGFTDMSNTKVPALCPAILKSNSEINFLPESAIGPLNCACATPENKTKTKMKTRIKLL